MPRLEVHQLKDEFVYRDVIRVNEAHRKDKREKPIEEGQIRLVRANGRECYAVLRGYQDSQEPRIYMDEYTRREKLGVTEKQPYDFEFEPVGLFGQLRWAWNATEMGYQVSSKLAVLGFIMGVFGLLFGIAGLFDWHGLIAKLAALTCLVTLALVMLGLAVPGGKGQMINLSRLSPRPEWLTGIFTAILAVTAIAALWIANSQLKESHREAQIQHLLTLQQQFEQEPMVTYRRGLAEKRLKNQEDPDELYPVLDFFDTAGMLVERGYLDEEDVWSTFGYWILNLNADARQLIEQHQREDRNTYSDFSSLAERLQRIEATYQGTVAKPSKDEILSFYKQELSAGESIPLRRHPKPVAP